MLKKLLTEINRMREMMDLPPSTPTPPPHIPNEQKIDDMINFINDNIKESSTIANVVAITPILFDYGHPYHGKNFKKKAEYRLVLNTKHENPYWSKRDTKSIISHRKGRRYLYGRLLGRKVLTYYFNNEPVVEDKKIDWLKRYESDKPEREDLGRNIGFDNIISVTIRGKKFEV